MPKLDNEGFLVDENNEKILVNDNPVKVELDGFFNQNQVNEIINKKTGKHKEQLEKIQKQFQSETIARADVDEIIRHRDELESQLGMISSTHKSQLEKEKSNAESWKNRYRSTIITNEILKHSSDFVDPEDLINLLSPKVKWVKDGEDQTPLVEMKIDNEVKALPITEAVAHIKQSKPHLVKGTNSGGFGRSGGTTGASDWKALSGSQQIAAGYK